MKKIIFIAGLILVNTIFLFPQDREIAVTVYNNDLAVVKDMRQLLLEKGVFELKYQDVASRIDPTSVHFKSLTSPESVKIFEQNYEYDLVNAFKIFEKYLDKIISIRTKQDSLFQGKLLSNDGNYLILENNSGQVKMVTTANVVSVDFPELPEGLITRPTLIWTIQNIKQGKHKTEVSYLTSGMNWHAEYVAVVKGNDDLLELNAWVSIENHAGAAFPNAKLKLIAGEINRIEEPRYRMEKAMMTDSFAAGAPQFEEKSFFEYHMYTLDQPTTLKNNQVKQISLFPAATAKAKKIFTFEPRKAADKVQVNIELLNSTAAGLGLPLPAGKVRVYKEDPADQSLEFIGEDKLDHTPKNEKIRLVLGNAFDIKVERLQLETKSTGKKSYEETWQIKIRNHKDEAIEVVVVEQFYGFWKLKEASHRYEKVSAQKLNFFVPVSKDAEAVLNYAISFERQ